MNANDLGRAVSLLIAIPVALSAQSRYPDPVMLKHWAAPLYWQPPEHSLSTPEASSSLPTTAHPLVFVAMTPCRVVDTRANSGFTGAFGPPSLVGGSSRTFPIPSSTGCAIPGVAEAYSFNITVVPPGPLGFITAYPTGQPVPLAATVNSPQGFIVGNAAIVPAGTNGAIDVYASDPTDIVVDINGYYASVISGFPTANIGLGQGALQNDTTGSNNIGLGSDALQNNTTGSYNISLGSSTLQNNTTGSDNIALGNLALRFNTTGGDNIALGTGAMQYNTTGSGNVALGPGTLGNNASGVNNTAVGSGGVLGQNTTGGSNTAVGNAALFFNTTGTANTATGQAAMGENTSGPDNVADGVNALLSNTTGGQNTAIGMSALYFNTTGSNNTAIGTSASAITTGSNNIAIGANAATNVSGGNSNNIHIGSLGAPGDGATIRIGNPGTQSSFFAAGIRGDTTGSNDAVPVVIDSNGQLGTVSSSRRLKEDIEDMGAVSRDLMRLRPVTFRYKQPFADGSKPIQYGLIAEEVAEVYPDLVAHSASGQIETVKYQVLDSMLLNELQKEHRQIEQQLETIHLLENRLTALEQAIAGRAPPLPPAAQ
jgi:hypothetical protein